MSTIIENADNENVAITEAETSTTVEIVEASTETVEAGEVSVDETIDEIAEQSVSE